MGRRRRAAVTGLVLVVAGAAGAVALADGDEPAGRSSAAASPPPGATVADGSVPDSVPISASTAVPPPSSAPTSAGATVPPASPATSTTATPTTPPPTSTTVTPIVTHDARVGVGVLTPVAVAAPVRVEIPAVGVDGPVLPTGVDEDGGLAIPDDARELVWWRFGPTPGAPGSAVIAGHLDWRGVRGVFADLAATPVGAPVTVTYDDEQVRTFVVASVELVDKPAVAVDGTFARGGDPVLRLVTCGGEFDRAARHYRSNVVVTAVPG